MFFVLACIAGGSGVVLGAFAAHGLKNHLDANLLNVFEVGVRYQMMHALALLAVSVSSAPRWIEGSGWFAAAGWSWIMGMLVFSGSLYLLALTGIRWLGAITPVGGVALILGWVLLGVAAIRCRDE